MTTFAHSQSDTFLEARSPITGRRLLVNPSFDKVLVPADMNIDRARALGAELPAYWETRSRTSNAWAASHDMRDAYHAFAEVRTLDDFMSAIDRMADLAIVSAKPRAQVRRMLIWLTRLWSHGLVAVPPKWVAEYKINCAISPFTVGPNIAWFEDINAVASLRSERERRRPAGLALRIAATAVGVEELGDLTPQTTAEGVRRAMGTRAIGTIKAIIAAQGARYGPAACPTTQDWGMVLYRPRIKSDPNFLWSTVEDPTVKAWRESLVQWLAQRRVKSGALKLGEFFLNYLIANPAVTRSPEQFCRRSYTAPVPYREWLDIRYGNRRSLFDTNNLSAEFFGWLLDVRLATQDNLGRPVRSPNHWNPCPRMQRKQQPIHTHREAMPTRYIRELVHILTDDDHAWPKALSSEWLPWHDPDTGQWQKIWSPVRASALLLKLHLPLRTYQVRMLDSGEADTESYADGRWVPNTGPLAPAPGRPVRRGFLRKFTDPASGAVHTGFYVNTNKTQDRGIDERDMGYEIPWQHGDVIAVVTDLLNWQQRYNPIRAPLPWSEIHDNELRRKGSLDEFARRDHACFLFRDPCGTYHNEPITDSRLRPFWLLLLDQLERRVAARGETLADGSVIRFIDKRDPRNDYPLRAAYDLHTLRVTLITALATEGGVPIPILSKCIAGHASILMTLYYVKLGAAQITETLARAQRKIGLEEQRNFLRFLQSAERDGIAATVASNDASGLIALHENTPGSWVVGDQGICPVGGALCHVGGPKLSSNPQLADYAPTPGGPRNCVRCRFFITGPAFLGALVAHFNAIGVRLVAAAEQFRAREAAIRRLEDEVASQADHLAQSDLMDELNAAQDHHHRSMRDVDDLSHNLHAVYRLTERCRAIVHANADATPDGLNLVLVGDQDDFEAAIEMTTDFELVNAVCQAARVYPGDDPTLANLRRARILDAMLARNGCRPVFSTLTEDEALAVGNELVNLLVKRFGHTDAVSLIEGERIMDASGIAEDVQRMLRNRPPEPLDHSSPLLAIRNDRPVSGTPLERPA